MTICGDSKSIMTLQISMTVRLLNTKYVFLFNFCFQPMHNEYQLLRVELFVCIRSTSIRFPYCFYHTYKSSFGVYESSVQISHIVTDYEELTQILILNVDGPQQENSMRMNTEMCNVLCLTIEIEFICHLSAQYIRIFTKNWNHAQQQNSIITIIISDFVSIRYEYSLCRLTHRTLCTIWCWIIILYNISNVHFPLLSSVSFLFGFFPSQVDCAKWICFVFGWYDGEGYTMHWNLKQICK